MGETLPSDHPVWTNAWAAFVPFLQFDNAIRQVIYTANAIEPVNPDPPGRQGPRSFSDRGRGVEVHVSSHHEPGAASQRWSDRWKAALNAFEITFADRWPDARTY